MFEDQHFSAVGKENIVSVDALNALWPGTQGQLGHSVVTTA